MIPSAVLHVGCIIETVGTSGVKGTERFNVLEAPGPQEFSAVTVMVPPFAPAVADIEVEAELPLQPDGNVQLYDVAPGTGDMV